MPHGGLGRGRGCFGFGPGFGNGRQMNGGWRHMFGRGLGRGLMRRHLGLAVVESAALADSVANVATASGRGRGRGRQPRCCRRTLAVIAASLRDARGAGTAADQRAEKGA